MTASAPSLPHGASAASLGPAPLGFQPGLEGLRGVAVLAVLAFHAGFGWAAGGYLGVSTFFTLSGFLIATLLLRTGPGDAAGGWSTALLTRFWSRRARRLVPASLLALAGVVVFGALVADAAQRSRLPGDVAASMASVVNWRFIAEGQSYADLFGAPSPLLHFWSLAVEVQFYVLFPLLLLALARVRSQLARAVVLLGLAGLSAAWGAYLWSAGASYDRIYYGTDTRAGELLVGAGLACLLAGGRDATPRAQRVVATAGLGAMAVLGVLYASVDLGSPWLVQGGLAIVAVLSATVVAAAIVPFGPVRTVLSLPVVGRLGQISFGVYLFHWPIFLWLRQSYGWSGWLQFLVGGALSVGLGLASFAWVEEPVRRGALHGRARAAVPAIAVAALLVGVVVVGEDAPAGPLDRIPSPADELVAPEPPPASPPGVDRPAQVLVVGDPAAADLASRLTAPSIGRFPLAVETVPEVACGERLVPVDEDLQTCAGWVDRWAPAVETTDPDVVVWAVAEVDTDVLAAASGGSDELFGPDAALDLRAGLEGAAGLLQAGGASLLVVELPEATQGVVDPSFDEPVSYGHRGLRDLAMSDPSLGFLASGDLPPYPSGLDTAELEAWFDAVGGLVGAEVDARLELASTPTPPRVMMVGDSVGWFLGHGLEERADAHGLDAWNTAVFGCGIGRGGEVVHGQGAIPSAPCDGWPGRWTAQLDDFAPDVVVVHTGLWDLTDRRLPAWDAFHHIGEPIYDRWLAAELDAAVDVLTSRGASVVWLTSPCHDVLDEGVLAGSEALDDARLEHLNDVVLPALDRRHDAVALFDLDRLVCPDGAFTPSVGNLDDARPDGVHFSGEASRWIVDQLLASAVWTTLPEP